MICTRSVDSSHDFFLICDRQAEVFDDSTVVKVVEDQLKQLNISVYKNYVMEEWINYEELDLSQPIEHVLFRMKDGKHADQDLTLKCTVRSSHHPAVTNVLLSPLDAILFLQ